MTAVAAAVLAALATWWWLPPGRGSLGRLDAIAPSRVSGPRPAVLVAIVVGALLAVSGLVAGPRGAAVGLAGAVALGTVARLVAGRAARRRAARRRAEVVHAGDLMAGLLRDALDERAQGITEQAEVAADRQRALHLDDDGGQAFGRGGLHRGGSFGGLPVGEVGFELRPACKQSVKVVLSRLEPAVVEVRLRAVGDTEEDLLEAENHRLMHQLPLVRVGDDAVLHGGDELGIGQLVLKADVVEHRRAVGTGEVFAVVRGGGDGVQFFADDGFGNRSGVGFGLVTGVEAGLRGGVDFRLNACCLFGQQRGAGFVG